jgi:hypothetical protein
MSSIRRVPLPSAGPAQRKPSALAVPVAAWAVAGATLLGPTAAQAYTDTEQPQARRDTLLARVAAVRATLYEPLAEATAPALDAPLLTAQATTWTNWPKWSKWSNWANK